MFLLEQKKYQDFTASFGGRLESVRRKPEAEFGLPSRDFSLASFSIGAMIPVHRDLEIVTSLSTAERAPGTEELYSHGPHESTLTFDIGDPQLRKETSRNLEFSLQKSSGLFHWKINAFINNVKNYVYGQDDGVKVNEEGDVDPDGEFIQRHWRQANATIRGGEAEIGYNQVGEGFSVRGFADTSRGTLDGRGNLPLQAANRIGLDFGFRHQGWRNTISVLHAQRQSRLASNEHFSTPAFTKVDLNLTYTHPYQYSQLTWFMQVRNLLNQDIRLATSVLKETVPQPMRGLVLGVRANF
jgi:iron complex outermembrane receptor protein